MDKREEDKVTKADLQDPFFVAGYEMVADAVIEGVFGSHPFQHDDQDSDGDLIQALTLRAEETGELHSIWPWKVWRSELEGWR